MSQNLKDSSTFFFPTGQILILAKRTHLCKTKDYVRGCEAIVFMLLAVDEVNTFCSCQPYISYSDF